MNWAEEKFVKVFTRDTPTWLCWPWQARALAPLLMRKLEGDGRLAVGRIEPARAVACTVGIPEEVVKVGLDAMLEDGTLELREDGLWWPQFEEAQESRKSEALRLREHRAKQRRENTRAPRTEVKHDETPRTFLQPSRPEQTRTDQNRTDKSMAPTTRAPRESDVLCEDFQEIIHEAYVWQGAKDGVAFTKLRKQFSLEEIRDRWRKGLNGSGWLGVRTIGQLASKWNDLAGDVANGKPDWLKKRNQEQAAKHVEGEFKL